VGIIGACGVGGGSLVFGGVPLEPEEGLYRDPAWTGLGVDWGAELGAHYETARRMLGRALNPSLTEMDDYMRATAELLDATDTFGPEPLAIFFGAEGETVPDPFFGGQRPARTGCRLCGGCFAGCPSPAPTHRPVAPGASLHRGPGQKGAHLPADRQPRHANVRSYIRRRAAEHADRKVANKSTTAHILGGAVIAANAAHGVIDTRHELFGHPGLYVVDASAFPSTSESTPASRSPRWPSDSPA
jgi:GMC oxidoreductase